MPVLKEVKAFIRGGWDAEIVDELKPPSPPAVGEDGVIVLDKTQNSAFWKTGLEERLRGMGVDQVIVSGVGTNVCVEATVRDAFANSFWAVVVADATATLTKEAKRASLDTMTWFADVVGTVEEVEEALKLKR